MGLSYSGKLIYFSWSAECCQISFLLFLHCWPLATFTFFFTILPFLPFPFKEKKKKDIVLFQNLITLDMNVLKKIINAFESPRLPFSTLILSLASLYIFHFFKSSSLMFLLSKQLYIQQETMRLMPVTEMTQIKYSNLFKSEIMPKEIKWKP